MQDGGRGQMCAACVMEGRWKMLKHFVLEYEEFDIDVGFWKGSRELWEQRSG